MPRGAIHLHSRGVQKIRLVALSSIHVAFSSTYIVEEQIRICPHSASPYLVYAQEKGKKKVQKMFTSWHYISPRSSKNLP